MKESGPKLTGCPFDVVISPTVCIKEMSYKYDVGIRRTYQKVDIREFRELLQQILWDERYASVLARRYLVIREIHRDFVSHDCPIREPHPEILLLLNDVPCGVPFPSSLSPLRA